MIRFLAAVAIALVTCSLSSANDDIAGLIGKLAEVSEPSIGYSSYFSGSEFLPYEDSSQMSMFVLGATHRARSETLLKIVAKGAEAVPTLLKHLSDDRKINMKPMTGMMWISFQDEYDFNRRIRETAPAGVNGDSMDDVPHPDSHAVTVGDLCFVALGQIVNRNFRATRYQPTGGLVVSSPTHSQRLRNVLIRDWKEFTKEKHRQGLIQDFRKSDHEDRRIGAYRRLSFYYPDAVEALVLEELRKPTYNVFEIEAFCREKLYTTTSKTRRKELYSQFIRDHGDAYTAGVLEQLFDDLDTLELHEQARRVPPFGSQSRAVLFQLFDKPFSVRSAHRPFMDTASESERTRLIRALTHDKSKKIGDAVQEICLKHSEDDYMASACLCCLAYRGYGEFLIEQLDKIDLTTTKTKYLHLEYLRSIGTSREERVQDKLLAIIRTTVNDDYFMAALAGAKDADNAVVLERAKIILNGLPKDTDQGQGILEMIGKRFPSKAKGVFENYLATGSAERAEAMCRVLWSGSPFSKELLAPLLDDKRKLDGYSVPMRVCDMAAQAISHTTEEIEFDSEGSLANKDVAIVELKKFCAKSNE